MREGFAEATQELRPEGEVVKDGIWLGSDANFILVAHLIYNCPQKLFIS